MSDYNVDTTGRFPIKAWTKGVQVEDVAVEQLRNIANMPFIHKHIAVMPDVHWGMGATIGSVIATKGAIIPAAALHFAHYNLSRIHGSLRVTPGMAAGLVSGVWDVADLLSPGV